MHTGKGYNILQTLQLPHDQSPMRPRTRIRDVKMVSIFLSGELGAWLVLDEAAEDGLLPLKLAALVARLDPIEDRIFLILYAD